MGTITVDCREEDSGWTCEVRVSDESGTSDHTVSVPEGDYRNLSGGYADVEKLVEESFEFLLEREPKESIMGEFDIMTIARYFPEYEDRITDRLS